MGNVPFKFLIDGIDRLGKSSMIQGIQQELGYHLVIHYDKPRLLVNNLSLADDIKSADMGQLDPEFTSIQHLSRENIALRLYQEDANQGMFELLKTKTPMIFDRTHLGELVYAPLYRKYSGEYVYEMEKDLIRAKPFTHQDDIRMILLTSSNTDMLVDDGLGFDPTKKNEEQNMFLQAFSKSNIVNKVIIDVHDGIGGYRPYEEILKEALYKPYDK